MRQIAAGLLVFLITITLLFAPSAIAQSPVVDKTLVVCVSAHPDDVEIATSGSLYKNDIGKHPIMWVVVTDGGADLDEYNYESNASQGWIAQDGEFNVTWDAPDGSNITRAFYSADLAKKRCGGSFEGLNWTDEAASHNSTFGVAYDWRTRVSGFVNEAIEKIQMGYFNESNPADRLAYPDGGLSLAVAAFRDSIAANLAYEINKSVESNGYQKSLLKIYSHATDEVCTNAGEHPDHQVVGNAVRQAIELLLNTYGFFQIDAKWFTVYNPINPKEGYVRVDENISLQQTQKSELAQLCWETECIYLRHINYTWTFYPVDPGTYEWSIAHSYYLGGPIYIRADGMVDPPSAPISNVDNIYYKFTADVYGSVVVERDNIVVDGAEYVLEGAETGKGVDLTGRSNVTIKSITIREFIAGIFLSSSSGNTLYANKIINNDFGIYLCSSSNNNGISANNITNNAYGIYFNQSSSNLVCHNNFIDNTAQALVDPPGYVNVWDDGYPSGGNYWSDYAGIDLYKGPYQNITGSDGIGDTPYVIDANNWDNYPLMNPWTAITNVASLVVRGGDNKVWYRTYSGTWESWNPIAAATGDSLGAAMIGNNLHIVARNLAGTQIWHGYVNLVTNMFSGWTLISGKPVSAPTLASNGVVLSLVVRGGDNKVWYRTYSGGVWGSWHSIAAATGDSLGAAMLGNNLHIIARDMSGTTIWHGYVDLATNVFSGWTLISGNPVSAPTLTSNGAVLSLVVRGGDNRVWYRTYSGGVWGRWYPIAAATGDSLGAAMLGNNLHIVARDLSGTTIWHGYVDLATNVFSGWTLISGKPISKLTLTS